MEFRYNPFWFESDGKPTDNLETVLSTLAGTFDRKLSTLFRRFDTSKLSFYVVGSNARGDWRSADDILEISRIFSELKEGRPIEDKEKVYLRQFYSEREIFQYLTPGHKHFNDPGRMYISDIDIKVKETLPKTVRDLLPDFRVPGLKSNDFWSGGICVLYGPVIPPYYSQKENIWVHELPMD